MKLRLFAVFVFLVTFAVLRAAPPSDESIGKMMSVMHAEKMLDQTLAQMNASMEMGFKQSLQGRELTPTQREAVENFKKKISGIMKEELAFAKMKDVYIQAYRETLTQEEVDAITTFYSSPAGKAVVDKIPVAMQKAGMLMQSRINPMIQKIQTMERDFAQELVKMGSPSPAASVPATKP